MMAAGNPAEVDMPRKTLFGSLIVLGLVMAACGGDDDPGQSPFGVPTRDDQPTETNDNDGANGDNEGGQDGSGEAGELTVTTDPGSATVVVDGETIDYVLGSGSIHYTCDIGQEVIVVNFQTGDGHDLLIQGALQPTGWVATINFKSADDENNAQYGATIPTNADAFGLGDNALSFEGTVSRMEDFDPSTTEDLPATIAVNCGSAGGDPMATIGGEDFVFPLSGAQSVTCDVADDAFEVRINRLAIDDLQLEAQGRQDGDNWVGAMVVYAGEERFTSPLPQDGAGIEIDGSTLTYSGTFESADGQESEGSLTVTCP